MPKVIVVNEERCLACNSCMIACAMAHTEAETLVEALGAASPPQPRVYVESAGAYGVPLQCRHCEDPPCIAICPSGAIDHASPDGPVLLDQERCIGCKFCMLVCPFGVIALSRDGKAMIKCDLCVERTEAGELPACVAACPTGALKFVDLDEHLRRRRREAVRRVSQVRADTDEP
jgi:carbon-monoxide dehydrogenase iron sulfur subunit